MATNFCRIYRLPPPLALPASHLESGGQSCQDMGNGVKPGFSLQEKWQGRIFSGILDNLRMGRQGVTTVCLTHWSLSHRQMSMFLRSFVAAVERHGNTPAQYSGKMDKHGRFELVFTVFCGFPTSRCPSAKGRKKLFSPKSAARSFVLVMSVDELVYVLPETGVDDCVMSVF